MKTVLGLEEPPTDASGQTQKSSTPDALSELRVKVAELQDFVWIKREGDDQAVLIRRSDAGGKFWTDYGFKISPRPDNWRDLDLTPSPNYPSDLNACAEFEKGLSIGQHKYYVYHLMRMQGFLPTAHVYPEEIYEIIAATAEQRCRAFVALHEGTP